MNSGGTQNTLAQSANALMQSWAGSRKKVSLWLDVKIGKDYEALEIIQYMKSKREFRRSVMLGLKIVWELSRGDVTTLLATYPDVVTWLEVKTVPPPDNGGGGQLEEIKGLLEVIAANQKANGGYTMASQPETGKPLAGSKEVTAPTFEDEDDDLPVVQVSKNTNIDTSANFLSSLSGLGAAPPQEVKQAVAASAESIADNFLSAFM